MIRSRSVRGPDGRTWTIRRRWAPRPRWRPLIRFGARERPRARSRERSNWWEFLDLPFQGLGEMGELPAAILAVVIVAAIVVFMIFVGVPLLVFLFETLLLIPVIVLIGIAGRLLFRRPWTIEASGVDRRGVLRVEWDVIGWRASSRAADRMAALINTAGAPTPEPPLDVVGPRAHRRLPR